MKLIVCDMMDAFLEHTKVRCKPSTHEFYTARLGAIREILGHRKVKKLGPDDWAAALKQANLFRDGPRKGQSLAPDTIRGNGSTLKLLQAYGIKKKLITEPLMDVDDIPMPKGKRRTYTPSPEQIHEIKSVSSPAFCLALDALRRCGARPGALAAARYEHYDQVLGTITLDDHKTAGKTGEPRVIAVGEKLKALILKSLGDRTEGHLFVKPMGKPWCSNSLSAAFRKARNELGLDKRLIIYRNRSANATETHSQFGLLEAQTAIGHVTGVIGHYVQIPIEEQQRMQDALILTVEDIAEQAKKQEPKP